MAALDWTTETSAPAQEKKELLHETTLSVGQKVKLEVGPEDEFDKTVPEGKEWFIVTSIRIVETDA
jgi:hypothetical protein